GQVMGESSMSMREHFPVLSIEREGRPLAYLDNAATTQKPLGVLDAVRRFYCEANGNVHRSAHLLNERAGRCYEDARRCVADFIGAAAESEIVFTRGATESLNMVARCLGDRLVGRGDAVVVTELEHHSNLVPWQELCRRKKATLITLPFDEEGLLMMDELDRALEIGPKLLCVTHVSNSLGTVNPVRDICERARAAGCLTVVDGAQAVAHLAVDVTEIGCDFYAFSGHKMYAEGGIGVLYGRGHLLEEMDPWLFGGGMVETVDERSADFTSLPARLEAGTPNVGGAVGLSAAITFLRNIGQGTVQEHEAYLLEHARDALSNLDGVRVHGSAGVSCGLVSFSLEGAHPFDVGSILDKFGVAVGSGAHCAQPVMRRLGVPGTLRASLALYNDTGDIDALIEGLKAAREMLR
ncbi:MAG: aminotransferase class V-fold PLP-dependent enzyme, partial [Myxococcota bacterium]